MTEKKQPREPGRKADYGSAKPKDVAKALLTYRPKRNGGENGSSPPDRPTSA